MNKYAVLYTLLIITSFSVTGCAEPRTSDDRIDACKLTKPPKEAVVKDLPHMGEMYKYPGKLPVNYSGCKKIWINNQLIFSIIINNGNVSRIEFFDPDGEKAPEVCNYDNNRMLIKDSSSACTAYGELHDDLWKN